MIDSRLVLWTALALAAGTCADAQTRTKYDLTQQGVLSLSFANHGQRVSVPVGQQIEVTLGMVGPAQYDDPQVSSPAVRFECSALDVARINPGGPILVFIFEAAAEGEAHIIIPVTHALSPEAVKQNTFRVTIHVGSVSGNLPQRRTFLLPDQENTESWKNGWLNLAAIPRQSFVPSLPKLTGVEVELVAAKPEPTPHEITMELTNVEGTKVLASVVKTVDVADCNHVQFLLPYGGVQVSPGQVYNIRLVSFGGVFGWKYVIGGYAKGDASWSGKLANAERSTFLFRTFGAHCVSSDKCGAPVRPEI